MPFFFSRRATKTVLLSLACAGAIALATAPTACSSGGPTVSSVCGGRGVTCQTRLTVLHSADVHSRLFPYDLLIAQVDSDLGLGTTGEVKNVGGVARMSYILGRERARSDRVLHLDAGDYFEGAPIFNFFAGEPEMRAASALGVDAMALGNHEFDKGAINAARQIQKWANFPVLAANYKFQDPLNANSSLIGTVINPFTVFNQQGLKIAVIGMGNLSSLASIFDQPNSLGILPLQTEETAQFYVDLLRPYVDVIIMLTHLGLDEDEAMVHGTTGIDVVVGGHNHIVINPPQQLTDCTANPNHPGYIWAVDPNLKEDPNVPPPNDPMHPDPANHPYMFQRPCTPRNVLVMHSGAFSKYVGRLDLIFSNDPAQASPTGNPADYDPLNGFEVLSSRYNAFPIDDTIPDDPVLVDMLQPYQRTLDRVADLNILAGFSPTGAKRIAPQQGDSPLGNLVSTSMWLRLGVQTDFSLTNSTGIRTDLNPGPVPIEELFNIFPFDNTITKMELSGIEVRELFDFVARRSAGRSCDSQAQIAGARVRINCSGCNPKYRPDTGGGCNVDADCSSGANGACDLTLPFDGTHAGTCAVTACAEEIYIGHLSVGGKPVACNTDDDCAANKDVNLTLPGQCDKPVVGQPGTCLSPLPLTNPAQLTNLYELATNNYIAAGGSGFRVLQRNTTQLDTLIQQRDALSDYMRQGKPCGYHPAPKLATDPPEGLKSCSSDSDCTTEGDFVCACPGPTHSHTDTSGGAEACVTDATCDPSVGLCVRRDCRDQVSQFHEKTCATSPQRVACQTDLAGCSLAGEECKFLACIDETEGAVTDNRIFIIK